MRVNEATTARDCIPGEGARASPRWVSAAARRRPPQRASSWFASRSSARALAKDSSSVGRKVMVAGDGLW